MATARRSKIPDLQLATPRADALQTAIHDELVARGFTTGEDKVMAEYVLIMLINKKTPEQVNSELSDFIGPETWDPTFVDWLFEEANKENPGATQPAEEAKAVSTSPPPTLQAIPTVANDQRERERERDTRRGGPTPRLYNQAVSGAQKRSASNRSPSPSSSPNKAPRRNNDTPSGPRSMRGDPQADGNKRSLKDRLGGFGRDPVPNQMGMPGPNQGPPGMRFPGPGIPPMGAPFGPEMQGMNPNFAMTDMLMQQNALLQGLLHTMANGMQMGGMPGGAPFPGMGPGGPPPFNNGPGQQDRRGRPERRDGSFRPNAPQGLPLNPPNSDAPATGPPQNTTPIAAPIPGPPGSSTSDLFDRPLSPTLCKFGVNCGNALCRWSHPSAAASAESGVVLSTEACPSGRKCQDKDCTLSHPSAGTNRGIPGPQRPPAAAPAPSAPSTFTNPIPCKFGVNCTRPGCPYSHPTPVVSKSTVPCKFGVHCTRADCMFSHPSGRVNPASFKGIAMTPDKPHANRSMRFNTAAPEFVPKAVAGSQTAIGATSNGAGGVASADKKDESTVTPSATTAKDPNPAEVVAAVR